MIPEARGKHQLKTTLDRRNFLKGFGATCGALSLVGISGIGIRLREAHPSGTSFRLRPASGETYSPRTLAFMKTARFPTPQAAAHAFGSQKVRFRIVVES